MIYITGDVHGDKSRFESSALRNLKKGDTLIICGDFGFLWNGDRREKKALEKLSKKKYNICFVDGTHENFELLNSYEVSKWNGGKVHNIAGNIYHLMRGNVYEIEGKKFFAFGGASSHDIRDGIIDPAKYESLKAAVNDFLSSLSVRDRAVFVRRYYFFEDAAEIGAAYGISAGYVRTVLMRTRKKLKRYMKGALL